MRPTSHRLVTALAAVLLLTASAARAGDNLVPDPSFEEPREKDRFGHVFAKWGGWNYEGDCEFRVGDVAHTGKHSLLMVGGDRAQDPRLAGQVQPRTGPLPRHGLPARPRHRHGHRIRQRPSSCSTASTFS